MALPDRDLDAIVAEKVRGWHRAACECWPQNKHKQDWLWEDSTLAAGSDWNCLSADAMLAVLNRLHDLHPNWRASVQVPWVASAIGSEAPGEINVWDYNGRRAHVPFATVTEMPRAVAVAVVLAMEGVSHDSEP